MDTTIWIVIGAALVTAIMTGVGALPFLCVKKPGKWAMGWSNAAAAGLMPAASHSLVAEGGPVDSADEIGPPHDAGDRPVPKVVSCLALSRKLDYSGTVIAFVN